MLEHWFLLRGLGREPRHWGEFPKKLENSVPNRKSRCLGFPGSGRYHNTSCPAVLPEITDFIRKDFLKQKAAFPSDSKSFLIGLSLGGMVGVDWLERYPTDFQAAVFINTSSRGFSPPYRRFRPSAFSQLVKIVTLPGIRNREWRVLQLSSNQPENHRETLKEWVDIAEQAPMTKRNFLSQLRAAATYQAPKQLTTKVPILLLVSENDQIVHPSCSKSLAQHWRVPIKTHPSAGHDLALDDSSWLIEAINDWQKSSLDSDTF